LAHSFAVDNSVFSPVASAFRVRQLLSFAVSGWLTYSPPTTTRELGIVLLFYLSTTFFNSTLNKCPQVAANGSTSHTQQKATKCFIHHHQQQQQQQNPFHSLLSNRAAACRTGDIQIRNLRMQPPTGWTGSPSFDAQSGSALQQIMDEGPAKALDKKIELMWTQGAKQARRSVAPLQHVEGERLM
jgi:hypothetical protein